MLRFVWLPLCLALQADPALEQAVRDYWAALEDREKAQAMHFVHPDDLNKFLYRNEPRIESWKLENIERSSETEAQVTVHFMRRFPEGALLPVRAREVWQRLDVGWRVRIQSPEDYRRQLQEHLERPSELPKRLEVLPKTLRFYSHSDQPGVIVIRNGLKSPVQLASLKFDEDRFQVAEPLTQVAARSVGRIALRYIGDEMQPNLESSVQIQLNVSGELRDFQIPVLCNYVDPTLEWLRRQKPPQAAKPPAN